jgi:uncharacterized RDD family membrane protein YckC
LTTKLITRALHFAIDMVIISVLNYCLQDAFNIPRVEIKTLDDIAKLPALSIYISFAVQFIYYFAMEYHLGYTIGKMLTTCKVGLHINSDRTASIFKRTICRFIPLYPLLCLFTPNGLLLHDRLSKTVVIQVKNLQPPTV